MTLLRFDPVRGFEHLSKKINDFTSEASKGFSIETGGFTPRVDITEDETYIYVNAELPGMSKDDIKLNVTEDKMLTIKGLKSKLQYPENKKQIRSERIYGEFTRTFVLPDTVDLDKISASFVNGVLEVKLPKQQPEKPKEVEVNIL